MIGLAKSGRSATSASVCSKVDCAPTRGRNCFGKASRDKGHNRVPAPPHNMTGLIKVGFNGLPLYAIFRRPTRRRLSRDGMPISRRSTLQRLVLMAKAVVASDLLYRGATADGGRTSRVPS